jgi:predicted nucleic acid-binding protein
MSDTLFADTNLLLYALDASEPVKQGRAAEWMQTLWQRQCGRVSYQVLGEFYEVATRKRFSGAAQARRMVRDLASWEPLPPSNALYEQGWALQDRFQLAWWDALIVAAAQVAGCRYLLTEDLQDGQDFGGLVVVDPFRTGPETILSST